MKENDRPGGGEIMVSLHLFPITISCVCVYACARVIECICISGPLQGIFGDSMFAHWIMFSFSWTEMSFFFVRCCSFEAFSGMTDSGFCKVTCKDPLFCCAYDNGCLSQKKSLFFVVLDELRQTRQSPRQIPFSILMLWHVITLDNITKTLLCLSGQLLNNPACQNTPESRLLKKKAF